MNIAPPSRLNLSSLVAGGVVVTVAVVIISGFALKSLFGKLNQNNQLLSKKRVAQEQVTKNLEALSQLSQQYSALGPKRTLILDALPTTPNFPAIVSMMEELSKNAGVELLSVAPSEIESTGRVTGAAQYQFTASISGSYDSFKEFLRNVELSLRPMAITTMKISGNSSLLGVDMTISTYYQAEFDTSLKTEPLIKPNTATSSSSSGGNSNNLNPSQGVAQ